MLWKRASSSKDDWEAKFDEQINLLSWEKGDRLTSMKLLNTYCLNRSGARVGWYWRKATRNRFIAKTIRVVNVVLIVLAGIIPTVVEVYPNSDLFRAGHATILIALAGGLLLLDKLLGFSTAYSRFARSAMAIEAAEDTFRVDSTNRLGELFEAEDQNDFDGFIQHCRGFVVKVSEIVTEETREWAEEFRQGSRELSNLTKTPK